MKRYYPTRKTYAPAHRAQPVRSGATIYATTAGEGILRQTIAGDYGQPVVEIIDETRGLLYYLVESEKFAGRYYLLRQLDGGAWRFSGDDKLKSHYIAKVEAFISTQMCSEAVVA